MSKLVTKTAVFVMFFCAPIVYADKITVCKHDDAVREVHVVYEVEDQTVPCSVNYVKSTGTQTLWRADNMEGYCEQKAADFIAKQEGWGWSCEAKTGADEMMEDAISDSEVVDEAEEISDDVGEEVEEMTESE